MAKAPKKSGEATLRPEGQYRVQVLRPVEAAGVKLIPKHGYVLKGRIATELGDAIRIIEEVRQR